ncbi:MAG: RIP metalloprotease RseP [Proteobacteria bacterium]|nr:RIP metalloprotease RseP [Pseudomonadota bacterium]
MTTLISFIIVLGFLVLIHELGHFLVAKKLDVKVEKFSIGFGPRLFAFTKGETEYMISAIPLGGYVKLMGEDPGEEVVNDPREFASRPVSHRMAIIIAGPLMNLLLTFVLLPLVFMMGVNLPAYIEKKVSVGWVMSDSPAEESGFKAGDVVHRIDGDDVENWEKAVTAFASNPGRRLSLQVEREGRLLDIYLTPRLMEGNGGGYAGLVHHMAPVIGGIRSGSPAAEAGLMAGDRIKSVSGESVDHWIGMSSRIKASEGKPVHLVIDRGRDEIQLTVTPEKDEASGNYIIGVSYSEAMVLKKFGFVEAIKEGMKRAVDLTVLTVGILKKLVTLDLSVKSLGGPIMIAQATGAAAQAGLSELLSLMAFISLQLGILNLLPIPVLDGGHVFFLLAELALRKPVSIKAREIAQQIGFAILITLMLVVSYNDIVRVFSF